MKIGIYSPYLNSLAGGERYMLTIASCLQSNHKVYVFWKDKKIKEQAEQRFSIKLNKVQIVPDIFEKGIPVISSFTKTRRYDILILLSDGSIPLSFAQRNIIHFQRPFQNVSGKSSANQLKLKNYQAVVCNSQFTKKYIDDEFGVDSEVIYPPVDIDSFKPETKEKIILTVGRLHPFKKQDRLIKAFSLFSKKHEGWKFHIAGGLLNQDRVYFNRLLFLAKRLPVTIEPNCSFDKLRDLYGRATFYWHAAGYGEQEKRHPEHFEHFGIAPVESMAAGSIPLLFRGGGLTEIVSDFSTDTSWKTLDELISKTDMLIDNKTRQEGLRKEVMRKAQRFSSEKFCWAIKNLISKIT